MEALVTAPEATAEVRTVPIPEPGSDEIRVKVHSIALNPVDALYVAHPADKNYGRIVGSDIAGVIERVGSHVSEWAVGDRVAGLLQGATSGNPRPGGFAEYATLKSDLAIRIPDGVTFDEAATFPLCSLTAAQALFIRLEIPAPFKTQAFNFPHPSPDPVPTILVYSGATSLGLFTISLAKLLKTPSGEPYRVFATASPKNHAKLLALGADAVFDYNSPTWVNDVVRVSGGGVTHAVDCISEDNTTANISQTFVKGGGKIAVVRKSAWNKDGVRSDIMPLYGAVWMGLGYEIVYNNEVMPADLSWRSLTVDFFAWLSDSSPKFPIPGNPVRLMPGGLHSVVQDGFALLGSGKVAERQECMRAEEWMRPISGEKLVYRV